MWLYGLSILAISHNLAMFGDYWFSANGDITLLICHVTWRDHVVKGSCDFMSRSSVRQIWKENGFSLSRDLARPCNQRIIMAFLAGAPQGKSPPYQVGGHRHCVRRDVVVLVCYVERSPFEVAAYGLAERWLLISTSQN